MSPADAKRALLVDLPDNDAGATNVGGYLAKLLLTVLEEEESFSGKRPFGNSGWISEITDHLAKSGIDMNDENLFIDLVSELCGVSFS